MELNGTHRLLMYLMILIYCGQEIRVIKTQALLVASNENGLEVNADKTECIVMCCGKEAGKYHSIKTGGNSEIVGTFKCLRSTLKHLQIGRLANGTFMLPCIVIDLFLNNQPDALIIQILFCHKALHVSGIFSAHHQEFSTVHSALVSFMRVYDDRFQAESGWNCCAIELL